MADLQIDLKIWIAVSYQRRSIKVKDHFVDGLTSSQTYNESFQSLQSALQ